MRGNLLTITPTVL